MRIRKLAFVAFCLLAIGLPASAGISPQDVVVVYNNSTFEENGYDGSISEAVANYYCDQRGVPRQNKCGVTFPFSDESLSPERFHNLIEIPVKRFLREQAGLDPDDPNAVPDLATDPTKCIVLCYGVPILISGNGRTCSVDSALTVLFESTSWGQDPIGGYELGAVSNPYYEDAVNPAERVKDADFDQFRASEANHSAPQAPPSFLLVRFIDSTHALAAGEGGILYKGTLTAGIWSWVPVLDASKGFIAQRITDICVAGPQSYYVCTAYGAVIGCNQAAGDWQVKREPHEPLPTPSVSVSYDSGGHGWLASTSSAGATVARGASWTPLTVPNDFLPLSIAAVSAGEAWVAGGGDAGGIWHVTNADQTPVWTQVYSNAAVVRVWVQGTSGWAIADDGHILRLDGTTWTAAPGNAPTLTEDEAGNADLAVYDATHLAIACGTTTFYALNGTTWTTNTSSVPFASVRSRGRGNHIHHGRGIIRRRH